MNLTDLFQTTTLTQAIEKLPVFPSRLGAMGLFTSRGITTTSVVLDERAGRIILVPNTSRNDDPAPIQKPQRKRRTFETTHLPLPATLLPSEYQNIAPFGSERPINQQAAIINNALQFIKNSLDATREWQRVGAIRGVIRDADGSVIKNLFDALYDEFQYF
uniref:Phage major capsid protein E n=1 Tax=Candidatus Kentrum eta TaxID=2126337 RepID=A0A450VFQ7_9GAMM|nr:MAG: Phage major capsid protein E [Candidatus Kentron sp. H]VFK04031.1 MAG: Phage major capsid protein E [Candidatus Kentron sp. H]VFK06569.1 MAG: Phage major capsid protein E [Candidatus Kentron sp. H]